MRNITFQDAGPETPVGLKCSKMPSAKGLKGQILERAGDGGGGTFWALIFSKFLSAPGRVLQTFCPF